jgi:putative endonuclease
MMSRVSGKPYFVYVLWSERARRFYIGISEDLEQRLRQHNWGQYGWTRQHRPWILVYQRRFENYREARKHENLLKRQKGGDGFYAITGLNPRQFRASS